MENIKKVVLSVLFAGCVMSSGTIKTDSCIDCALCFGVTAVEVVGEVAIVAGTIITGLGGAIIYQGNVKYNEALDGKDSKNEVILHHNSIDRSGDSDCGCNYKEDMFDKEERFNSLGHGLITVGLLTFSAGVFIEKALLGVLCY